MNMRLKFDKELWRLMSLRNKILGFKDEEVGRQSNIKLLKRFLLVR